MSANLALRGLYRQELVKPDGRRLWLYGRAPIVVATDAPSPRGELDPPNPHLRWHPLRGEWVAYADHRQTRTFLPPPEYDPLAPTTDAGNPTELPAGHYDVAVFENRFPALHPNAHDPPRTLVPTLPGHGGCEVVVYTQDVKGSLGALPLSHVELVVRVWADRTRELGARVDVACVFPFENRGVEVGVSVPHPHGQIYAYPFVPPILTRELVMQAAQPGLLAALIAAELEAGTRIVHRERHAVAWVPVFARYAYEIWVAPLRAAPSLVGLEEREIADLARALKSALMKLDAMWQRPMPYVLAVHQAPTDGMDHPEAHVHIEIYPALRMKDRLKYLAGSEIGAGTFTADTLPEETARELRGVDVVIA